MSKYRCALALLLLCGCKKTTGDPELDKWVTIFEDEDREVFKHRDEVVALMGIEPGHAVADVGAGTGAYLDVLVKAVGPKGTIFAVDIDEKMIGLIEKRSKKRGYAQVKPVLSSTASVTLPPSSVDRMLVVATYHHFDDWRAMVTSIRDALKPGGVVWVLDFVRIEGVTKDEWVLNHVRAGEAEFSKEIESVGLKKLEKPKTPFLDKYYMVGFERPR